MNLKKDKVPFQRLRHTVNQETKTQKKNKKDC